jgi:hypothetical protein
VSSLFANLTVPFRGFINNKLSLLETSVNALNYAPYYVTRDLNSAISSVNLN